MARPRDTRGRFVKTPKPLPLDPALVASLREGQPAYTDWSVVPITLEIYSRSRAIPKHLWRITVQGEPVEESDAESSRDAPKTKDE
jgi:hypothetical protein